MAVEYTRLPRVGNCLLYLALASKPRPPGLPREAYFPKEEDDSISSDSDSYTDEQLRQELLEERLRDLGHAGVVPEPQPSNVIAEGQGSPEPVGEVDVIGSPGNVIGGGAAYYSPELANATYPSPAKNSRLAPSKLNFSLEEDISEDETIGESDVESREATARVRDQLSIPHISSMARKEVTVTMDTTGGKARIVGGDVPLREGQRSHLMSTERVEVPPSHAPSKVIDVSGKALSIPMERHPHATRPEALIVLEEQGVFEEMDVTRRGGAKMGMARPEGKEVEGGVVKTKRGGPKKAEQSHVTKDSTVKAGTGKAGTGKAGTGKAGTGKAGTGKAGTGKAGSGKAGTGKVGTGKAGTGKAGTGKSTLKLPTLNLESDEDDEVEQIMSGWRESRFLSLQHLSTTVGTNRKESGATNKRTNNTAARTNDTAARIQVVDSTDDSDFEIAERKPSHRRKALTGDSRSKSGAASHGTKDKKSGEQNSTKRKSNLESSEERATKHPQGRPRKVSQTGKAGSTARRSRNKQETSILEVSRVRTEVVETSAVVRSSRRQTPSRRKSSSSSGMWFVPEDISMSKIRKMGKMGITRDLSPRRLRSQAITVSSDEEGTSTTMQSSGAELTGDELPKTAGRKGSVGRSTQKGTKRTAQRSPSERKGTRKPAKAAAGESRGRYNIGQSASESSGDEAQNVVREDVGSAPKIPRRSTMGSSADVERGNDPSGSSADEGRDDPRNESSAYKGRSDRRGESSADEGRSDRRGESSADEGRSDHRSESSADEGRQFGRKAGSVPGTKKNVTFSELPPQSDPEDGRPGRKLSGREDREGRRPGVKQIAQQEIEKDRSPGVKESGQLEDGRDRRPARKQSGEGRRPQRGQQENEKDRSPVVKESSQLEDGRDRRPARKQSGEGREPGVKQRGQQENEEDRSPGVKERGRLEDGEERRSGGRQRGEDKDEEGGRPGVKRMGQQYEPPNSESDSDSMPRLKRRRGRPRLVSEEMDTDTTSTNTGEVSSAHTGTEPGAVEAGEGYGEMGRAREEEEGYEVPEEVVSVGAEMRVDPYRGEESEEEDGEEEDGGPYSFSMQDENANIEVVKTPGGRRYRRLEVARPTNPTPGVRRSKRARVPPIEPGQQIEYNRRRESGVSLQGILVPLQRESRGQGGWRKRQQPAMDEDFPILEFDHSLTHTPLRAKLVFTRSSAFCGTLHGDEPEEGGSEVVVQKLLTDKFISVGVLIFPPSAEKPNCNNDIHDMYFYVIKGRVQIEVNKTAYCECGPHLGEVKVPSGTSYSIVNLKNTPAEVHYTAVCVVTDAEVGEEPSFV